MGSVGLFAVVFATGALFSLVFSLCDKIKCTRLSRYAIDTVVAASFCFCAYAPCFFWADGEIKLFALFAAASGFALPRMFFSHKEPNSKL